VVVTSSQSRETFFLPVFNVASNPDVYPALLFLSSNVVKVTHIP
jgi:hypothetical protein